MGVVGVRVGVLTQFLSSMLPRHIPLQMDLVSRVVGTDAKSVSVRAQDERKAILQLLLDKKADQIPNDSPEVGRRESSQEQNVKKGEGEEEEEVQFPKASKREYVLRSIEPRPFHHDTFSLLPIVSRLYACFDDDIVRFALALGSAEF